MKKPFDTRERGAIWKNKDKQSDADPDFTGTLNVGGKDYWVLAWRRKEGANPKSPALSFKVKPKLWDPGKPTTSLSEDMDGDYIPWLTP